MKTLRKLFSSLTLIVFISLASTPAAFAAVNCDADNDGYITITRDRFENVVLAGNETDRLRYNQDGNNPPEVWANWFETYKAQIEADPGISGDDVCESLNFKKGAEPVRCDSPIIASSSGVYDTAKVQSLTGNKVNPGAFDTPNDGIDQNCDGADGEFIPGSSDSGTDLGSLVDRTINLLSRAVVVVSIIILIWGGILYATAAGDEQKTSKARKAIIGAIIGLIVGLLAPAVVNYITGQLG